MTADEPVPPRTVILESAADVFVAEGYTLATVTAIAERAGIGISSVYTTFGSKAELLAALITTTVDNSIFVDANTVIANAANGAQVINALADVGHRHCDRGYAIFRLGMQNSPVDAVIGEAVAAAAAVLRDQMRTSVDRLVELGVIDLEQSRADAVDILYFYLGPPAWCFLIDAGWSLDRARGFLADRARGALLLRNSRCA